MEYMTATTSEFLKQMAFKNQYPAKPVQPHKNLPKQTKFPNHF